ncbi:hypothetical protein GCM10010360_38090 [Streptomyces nogalater]
MDAMTGRTGEPAPSCRDLSAARQPDRPGRDAPAVPAGLAGRPPLLFAGECDRLRTRMTAVARGEAFLPRGGDRAESTEEELIMATRATRGASRPEPGGEGQPAHGTRQPPKDMPGVAGRQGGGR